MKRSDYITRLIEKAKDIKDPELVELIDRLIRERNYLEDMASIDPLTGLYNRRILNRVRDCCAIAMCDIDDFKKINDNYGHDFGDSVIKSVSQIIKQNVRANDFVCRYGGDEFLIAFVNCPQDIVLERLEKIRRNVLEEVKLPNERHVISMSFGVVIVDEDGKIEELIKKADTALYESKEAGKNQITEYKKQKVYTKKNETQINKN